MFGIHCVHLVMKEFLQLFWLMKSNTNIKTKLSAKPWLVAKQAAEMMNVHHFPYNRQSTRRWSLLWLSYLDFYSSRTPPILQLCNRKKIQNHWGCFRHKWEDGIMWTKTALQMWHKNNNLKQTVLSSLPAWSLCNRAVWVSMNQLI